MKTLKAIVLIAVLLVIAVALAVYVYYQPVFDRVMFRPCYYYPEAFADCR